MSPHCHLTRRFRARCAAFVAALFLAISPFPLGRAADAGGAEAKRSKFDIDAGAALDALKRFAEQSGRQLLYAVADVDGVTTNEVKGELTPRDAIERLIAGTPLVALQTENGAIAVSRGSDPNGRRAAPIPAVSDRPVASTDARASGGDSVVTLDVFSVTGSNIKRLDQEKVLPVTVFNKDAMDARAAVTPVEMLTALPQVTNVPLNESSASAATARGDNASINLRGIGSANTLVLLNGRRLAPHPVWSIEAGTLSLSANVNQLPTQGIERIDVLRDGASAVYGSDAVAGVINYITQREFIGTTLRTRFGQPEHGGGASTQATLTDGRVFRRGALRLLTTVDFLYREQLPFRERDFTRSADHAAQAPAPFNVPGSVFDGRATVGIWPAFRIGTGTGTNYFRPVGATPALTNVAPTRAANPEFYLNVNDYQNFGQSRSSRFNWFSSVEFDLNDRVTAFADASYYHSDSTLTRQPVLLNAPNADLVKPMSADDPYNPYGSRFYSPAGAPNADGTPRLAGTPQAITLLAFTFRDFGAEHPFVHSGVYRGVAGLRGKLGDAWNWETGALYSRAQTSDSSTPTVRESLLAQALQRTDATAFNPFGYTFKVSGGAVVADKPFVNPKSVYDTFTAIWRRDGFSAVTSVDARASGPLFTFRGRTVSSAIGGEFRKEQFGDRRAPFVGLNPPGSGLDPNNDDFILFSPKPDFNGDRTVAAGYSELVVPLFTPMHDVPLLHSLELTGAARFEHYSDFGNSLKPKFAANWKPVRAVMVRASLNQGFSAPTLPTLHAPTQYSNDATPGTVDTYRNPVTNEGPYVQKAYTMGNPKLLPVTSRGHSVGVVIEVPRVTGLSVSADYWDIRQNNVIGSYSKDQILNIDAAMLRAYTQAQLAAGKSIEQIDLGSGTASYRGNPAVARNAPSAQDVATFAAYNAIRPAAQQAAVVGTIASRTAPFLNLARAEAAGVDLGLNYSLPKFSFGRITVASDWSYLIKSYTLNDVPNAGVLRVERMNVDGSTRWRGTATIIWRRAAWTGGVSGYYTGAFADGAAPTTAANYNNLGAPGYLAKQFDSGTYLYRYVVHDVTTFNAFLSRRFDADAARWLKHTTMRASVVNLTDRKPPLASGNFGYSTAVHSSLFAGRTWSVEVTKAF